MSAQCLVVQWWYERSIYYKWQLYIYISSKNLSKYVVRRASVMLQVNIPSHTLQSSPLPLRRHIPHPGLIGLLWITSSSGAVLLGQGTFISLHQRACEPSSSAAVVYDSYRAFDLWFTVCALTEHHHLSFCALWAFLLCSLLIAILALLNTDALLHLLNKALRTAAQHHLHMSQ